jgi:mycofactocin precursor
MANKTIPECPGRSFRYHHDRYTPLFEEVLNDMEEKEKEVRESQNDMEDDDIFKTEEVRIEEMAIDGICGVY